MKLRMPGHDYRSRGYYFCTMVVRGRRPLFGRVVAVDEDGSLRAEHEGRNAAGGDEDCGAACGLDAAGSGAVGLDGASGGVAVRAALMRCGSGVSHQTLSPLPANMKHGSSRPYRGACVAYSPFGEMVVQHIEAMAHRPELEGHLFVKGRIVMPDHIHLLIYIHDSIEHPLGWVLNGFHAGVRRLWHQMAADGLPEGQDAVPELQSDGTLSIFEPGFNDNVVFKEGQLKSYYDYMQMNPFRLMQRKLHPDLFTRRWGRELLPGVRFDLYGNMFLLQRPWREAVRISRYATIDNGQRDVAGHTQYVQPKRLKTEAEVAASLQPYLRLARKGAVLITPCISPAEQALVQAAYAEGLPVIMLAARGFSEGYHPSRAHYDACAEGLLLQICPWRYDPQRQLTKDVCELLNGFASQLAEKSGM